MTNLHTPDRELNPPDNDVSYNTCPECNGQGFYVEFERNQQAWYKEPCETCDGEGRIEQDNWHSNEEW